MTEPAERAPAEQGRAEQGPAESGRGEPGPVEREARQLVEAAARWLSAVPDPAPTPPAAKEQHDPSGAARRQGPDDRSDDGAAPGAGAADEHLCHGCPWCRAKAAFGGRAGTDALESLAHLLGAAAESLALFAQARRDAAADADADADAEHESDGHAADAPRHTGHDPTDGQPWEDPGTTTMDTTDHGQEEDQGMHEKDEAMLEAVIWVDEEDDEEAAEERRRTR